MNYLGYFRKLLKSAFGTLTSTIIALLLVVSLIINIALLFSQEVSLAIETGLANVGITTVAKEMNTKPDEKRTEVVKVTLSGSDLCTIESVNLSSLNLKFDDFYFHLKGVLRNDSGLPKGTLTVNLTGDWKKFYELLVKNGRINNVEAELAKKYYGDKFRIIDGKISFLFFPIIKVIDSFPEFC